VNKVIKLKKDTPDIKPTTMTVDECKYDVKDKFDLKRILEFYENKKVTMTIQFDNKIYKILKFDFTTLKEIILNIEAI
jgi:hypothetical protein